jgi:hypothetical protein
MGKARIRSLRPRNTESPEVLDIAYRLCGERDKTVKLAKMYLGLKRQFPRTTLPEALVYFILQKFGEQFVFQEEARAGRTSYGGAVVDFWLPNLRIALRIQGNFWHSKPDQISRDEAQRAQLLGSKIDGIVVERVVDIWESRVYSCAREAVVRSALNGVEMGK